MILSAMARLNLKQKKSPFRRSVDSINKLIVRAVGKVGKYRGSKIQSMCTKPHSKARNVETRHIVQVHINIKRLEPRSIIHPHLQSSSYNVNVV